MKRPIYERSEDIKREAKTMNEFLNYLHSISKGNKVATIKAPRLYPFDYELTFKDKPWALVEIKCRTNKQDAYENYMIGSEKIRGLLNAAKNRGLSAFLLVSWADKIAFADAMNLSEQSTKAWGGRYDRNDPADKETVLHVPYSVFTTIKNKKFWE